MSAPSPADTSRFVSVPGMFNLRDLGGYRTADGRAVRWGRLFRSDAPLDLLPDSAEALRGLGIRTVLDLRRTTEIEQYGRVAALPGVGYHRIELTSQGPGWAQCRPEAVHRFLADRYLSMAEGTAAGIGTALRLLAEPGVTPALMHCHAGRDRTGVLAALTLALLGVPDELVADDYALSAVAEARYTQWLVRQDPPGEIPAAHLVATPRAAILLFLRELRDRHGDLAAYAAAVGLPPAGLASLRADLLTDPDSAVPPRYGGSADPDQPREDTP